jgi:hypothetical protein
MSIELSGQLEESPRAFVLFRPEASPARPLRQVAQIGSCADGTREVLAERGIVLLDMVDRVGDATLDVDACPFRGALKARGTSGRADRDRLRDP